MRNPLYPEPKNDYEILEDGIVRLDLGRGHFALVDLDDAPLIAGRKWHAIKGKYTCYAAYNWRPDGGRFGRSATVLMHRLLFGLDSSDRNIHVDHANHNGLDNRRSNIRAGTRSKNMANARFPLSQWGYRGVHRRGSDAAENPWEARIRKDGRTVHIGVFSSAEDAARAYDAAAIKMHGEFATTNFVVEHDNENKNHD